MVEVLASWGVSAWSALMSIAWQTGLIFYDSALYILIGCLAAGLLHAFVPADFIVKYLGRNSMRSVAWAAILGAPVPLCSCSVLPTAMALRRKGASKPAIASFLISVPETDVENVAITYGLMGPVMAVYRPIAGIVTALAAGALTILFRDRDEDDGAHAGHDHDHAHGHDHKHDHDHDHDHGHRHAPGTEASTRAAKVFAYGFVELLDEIAFWITLGLVLTGIMLGLLPSDFFARVGLDSGIAPMLLMILISVPLYTCASMSAPVGAGLIAVGMSPGAALVYLLCGPATSMATLPLIGRLLGARLLVAYLVALIGVALVAGLALDWLAADIVREAVRAGRVEADTLPWMVAKGTATGVFVLLLLASARRGSYRHGFSDLRHNLGHLRGLTRVTGWRWRDALMGAAGFVGGPRASLLLARLATPGAGTMVRRGTAAAALAAAMWFGTPAVILVVGPGQEGLIQRFGRVTARELPPGFYGHWPWPLGRGIAVDATEVRQVTVDATLPQAPEAVGDGVRGLYLTSDENVIDVRAAVLFRVSDAYRATFTASDAEGLIHGLGRRALVDLIKGLPIDLVYSTGRAALEQQLFDRLSRAVGALDFGYEVVAARLEYVHAPADVHDSFRDVASALEDRARTIFEADGDATVAIAQAAGRAAESTARATAEAVAARSLARGKTAPFAALAAAHVAAPAITEQRLFLESVERTFALPRKYLNGAGLPDSAMDLWLESGKDPVVKFRLRE
jgi:uncharacterized membrane protein YraQ (UPF0718 family)/regulator of protease activity HflC (stomatin/prohibitin superfamily)